MRVLLLGSGGREHALAEAILRSPLCESLICAPGNAGMAALAPCIAIDPSDPVAVVRLAKEHGINFAVVAPDNPLVAGVVDALEAAGIPAFGPTKAAAQLEGSKGFTKDLCREAQIPTAAYRRFNDAAEARTYAASLTPPFVIKADGLALGKGVVIPETAAEADAALTSMFEGALGASRREVVIEEFLQGEEISFFVLCDGVTALPLTSAQDHKRAFDGDKGPNTGGMGAYSPALAFTPALEARTMREIIQPTLDIMRARGTPFKGVLYAGLMLTADGPKLIEYNVRFGDPEAQVLIPRLKSDLLGAMLASRNGALNGLTLDWHDDVALTVVMATKGYPGPVVKGTRIGGLEASEAEGAVIYHAGTARDAAGNLVANGGRVLNITARGATVRAARDRAYAAAAKIDWPEGYCRSDIGWRALGA